MSDTLAHHLKNVYKQDVDLAKLAKGHAPQFSGPYAWYRHAEAWLSNPYQAEMIVIKYEELKQDPVRELRRFCQFAGIERDDAFSSGPPSMRRSRRCATGRRAWGWTTEPGPRTSSSSGEDASAAMRTNSLPPSWRPSCATPATLRKLGYL